MSLFPLFPITNQFQDRNGAILVSGFLRVYFASRTDVLPNTYKDKDGTAKNPRDIILDNNGRAEVYVDPSFAYNLFVYDCNGNQLWSQYTILPGNVVDIQVSGLQMVEHDETLSGAGTTDSPLCVNPEKISTKSYVDSQIANVMVSTNAGLRNLSNEIDGVKLSKQDRLTAGTNVEITEDNVINVTGGGSGNGKVAVSSGKVADYLKNVLVSDCDEITLTEMGNQYRIGVNLTGESDPKLATMDEFAINSATSNYGSYELKEGYDRLIWGDVSWSSYSWLNAQVYQCMRISDAQGTISKCNIAICGSISLENPPACLNIGVFDNQGNLLGMTGLKYYGIDFSSGTQLCSFDVNEFRTGALQLKRNTRYIVQVWSCGLQLAGLNRGDSYNYTYDFNLRQNMSTHISQPIFKTPTEDFSPTTVFPFVSFGAANMS